MKKFLTLLRIEGMLGVRCPDGIIFGIGMPVGVLLLMGVIAGDKAVYEGAAYTFLDSGFSALITVGICATAFMGIPLTISGYRNKKILKHFFVTPVSPLLILAVEVVVCMITALVSAAAVTLTAVALFGYRMQGNVLAFIGGYFLVMLSMYSIGMVVASLCRSMKIANLVCNIIYFPMLLLSGATIPYELFPKAMQNAANVLPLSQGIKLLKGFSTGTGVDNLWFSVLLLTGIAVVCIGISVKTFRWE